MKKNNISSENFSKESAEVSSKTNRSGLESDIEALRSRLKEMELEIEKEKPIEGKKEEIIKKEIRSYIQQIQNLPSFSISVSQRDEAKEISKFEPNQQINALVSLVFEKNLKEAVEVAKDLKNPAILDEFHDVLVDRFYEELIKRKII